jgi:hypothetical protein
MRRSRQLGLAMLDKDFDARRYTGVPRATEAEIQKAVLGLLEKHPRVAWAHRMNTGVTRAEYTNKAGVTSERFIRFAFKGCSDILGQLKDGRFLAIECKRHDGKLSDAQAAFLEVVQRNHGVAGVARSAEDAQRIVEEREREDDRGDPF